MEESLGKAVLDLEANLQPFERNVRAAKGAGDDLQHSLDALAAVSKIAEDALNRVKMSPGQASESKASARGILEGVHGISEESRIAAHELDRVRITEAQASESEAAGDRIERNVSGITRHANEARRALESVKIAGGVPGRSGVGVGPFGSGFGRVGLLGAGIGAGVLTGPAAAPAAAGLLASIPTLAAGGVGALGTLVLAFDGVGKAIKGDKKAFDELQPSAQKFVLLVRSLDDTFKKLRQTAGAALFPGLTKALKSALSPELIGTVTRALTQLGHALGQAGAQWGRYFGSPAFAQLLGPLMQAGARNIGVLSDTFLHLFDALGTLGKAAIPFTSWLTTAIDKGAKLADSWLHAKGASGALGHALNEAKTSLQLVWHLFTALVNAVGSLGAALYPVAKVAVKDLTDGLNALAGIIDRNKQTIRDIVGGALAALVSTVKTLTPLVRLLAHALIAVAHAMGGWKTAFELVLGGFLASKFIGLAQRVAKVGLASEAAAAEVGGLRGALLGLGSPQVLAALTAVAGALAYIHFLRTQNANITQEDGGTFTSKGKKYAIGGRVAGTNTGPGTGIPAAPLTGNDTLGPDSMRGAGANRRGGTNPFREPNASLPYLEYELSKAAGTPTLADDRSVLTRMISVLRGRLSRAHTLGTKTALQNAIDMYAAQLQAAQSSPYGDQPPFTKNVGAGGSKPAVIPPAAARAETLASANASRASVLGNVGPVAKRYLEAELADLQTADKLIKSKYEASTGKARTHLFAALTAVENKIRTVRERIGKSIKDGRAAELKFAVDQAKEAVAAATVGSDAWKKAIAAEAKALRAEIAYWDRRAHNKSLSIKARDAALRTEIADQRALKDLLKPSAVNAGGNEAQFLSSFAEIVKSFAPNAFPAGKPSSGKTDTHLYDLVQESRRTNSHLKSIVSGTMFPATAYERGVAVAG